MAYIVMAHVAMAYIITAYVVMAHRPALRSAVHSYGLCRCGQNRDGLYTYGLHSYDQHSYGLHSHGPQTSFPLCRIRTQLWPCMVTTDQLSALLYAYIVMALYSCDGMALRSAVCLYSYGLSSISPGITTKMLVSR